MNRGTTAPSKRASARPYYEALNRGCDYIFRCHKCQRLVTASDLFNADNRGFTPCCGVRKVEEPRSLTKWEWLKIFLGMIDFPYRKEFLAEFGRQPRAVPTAAARAQNQHWQAKEPAPTEATIQAMEDAMRDTYNACSTDPVLLDQDGGRR